MLPVSCAIEIFVQITFADFDDFWTTSLGSNAGSQIAAMAAADVEILKSRLRARLPSDAVGRIADGARANAIKGLLPA